ncbi:MAG: HD domain-containing phosphohydrolase, partial [Planctomycetota bacterium]
MAESTPAEPDITAERLRRLEYENARLRRVMEVSTELARRVALEELLPLVIAKVTDVMEADRSTLFLYDKITDELWTMVGEGLEISEIRMPADRGIAGRVAQSRRLWNIPDAYDLEFFDQTWDRKTGYRTRSVLCTPLLSRQGELLGVLQVLNRKGEDRFLDEDERLLDLLADQIGVHVANAALHDQIERLIESIVNAISIALDSRDPVTAGHSRRVTQYTLNIARAVHHVDEGRFREVRFTRRQIRELRYAGLLHDFGKVGVPEAVLQKAERLPLNWIHVIEERFGKVRAEHLVEALRADDGNRSGIDHGTDDAFLTERLDFLVRLNSSGFLSDEAATTLEDTRSRALIDEMEYDCLSIKRGTLTPDERAVIESHVVKTAQVLRAIPWPDDLKNVPALASCHHEAPNGTGYPEGLDRERIPLGALIMAVADTYDALTAQDRPYKPAIPHEKSAAILRSMAQEGKL